MGVVKRENKFLKCSGLTNREAAFEPILTKPSETEIIKHRHYSRYLFLICGKAYRSGTGWSILVCLCVQCAYARGSI